jgi:hypothetical protein
VSIVTKGEPVRSLEGLADETDIVVRFAWANDLRAILTHNYIKPSGGEPAFVALVVNGSDNTKGTP